MRRPLRLLVLITSGLIACGTSPTERDIESALDRQLQSVAGPWSGTSPAILLSFQLTEGGAGAVSGSGTMREAAAGSPLVPIGVSGSYRRPNLVLAFTGMVRNGRPVRGDVSGQYTSAGGISATLALTDVGGGTYAEQVTILLQESTP